MKRLIYVFLMFFFANPGFCTYSLNGEQSAILNAFFKICIQDEHVGYVMFNTKPICLSVICPDILYPDSKTHKFSVALKEGINLWQQISPDTKNLLITFKKAPNSIYKHTEVLFINKKLLLETLRKNSSLFQYILGPKATSKKLFEAIISSENPFTCVLKKNNVLIGIVLGFGTTNAIYEGRLEMMEELLGYIDRVPFQKKIRSVPEIYERYKEFLLFAPQGSYATSRPHPEFEPSFGFETLKDEYETLTNEMQVSNEKLENEKPNFIFGCLPKQLATRNLLKKLEKTQLQIQTLLASPNFLAEVMEIVTGEKYITDKLDSRQLIIDEKEINKIAAKDVWWAVKDFDPDILSNFISAFMSPKVPIEEMDAHIVFLNGYKKVLYSAKQNLENADKFFSTLDVNPFMKMIIPNKLYFKVITNGVGKELIDETTVSLKYQIFDPKNVDLKEPYLSLHESQMDLSNTIPGFAHGLKGMRIGETREIYIHPSLAYGLETNLEKGVFLRAIVTLNDIHSNPKKVFPPCNPENLSFILDPNFERDCLKKCAYLGKFLGKRLVDYLARSNILDVEQVKKYVNELYKKKPSDCELTENEQRTINRVYWNIYFSEGKDV